MISFGENIRRLRVKKSLTQIQVGKICGVSAKAISRYENDQSEPDLDLLFSFSKLYEVDYNTLLGYKKGQKDKMKSKSLLDNEIETLLNKCNNAQKELIEQLLKYIVNSDYDVTEGDPALSFVHERK